jgi:DNA-3-methyladenine glycosylase II
VLNGTPVEIAATQMGSAAALHVTVTGVPFGRDVRSGVTDALNRMLGLQADLRGFYRYAANDTRLSILARRFRGLKPPRFPSLLEALVNGIACQQLSLASSIQLLNRLSENFGVSFKRVGTDARAFPRPEDLSTLEPEPLRNLGFSRQKAGAIIELSRAIVAGNLDTDRLVSLDDGSAVEQLCKLRGVGRWTAEYVLLRGLGRLHIFPGDDVGARNNLQQWLGLRKSLDYGGVRRVLAKWKPYAGLIYFHLLLYRLNETGYLSCPPIKSGRND